MKGINIFSIKAIAKEIQNEEFGSESAVYNRLYFTLNRGAKLMDSNLIKKVAEIVKIRSEEFIESLNSMESTPRKKRTSKEEMLKKKPSKNKTFASKKKATIVNSIGKGKKS